MSSNSHDPEEFVESLSSKLSSRSRHVCVFLGAGAASACGLPTIDKLEEEVSTALEGETYEDFERQRENQNLEEILSRLRKIASLANDGQEIDGLSCEEADDLDERICQEIVCSLGLDGTDTEPMEDFARWAQRVDYHRPLEIFTVNYDLLIENSFDDNGIPYFDGFTGNLNARFKTSLVEGTNEEKDDKISSDFVRLWKLHGSVNWSTKNGRIVRLGRPIENESASAIYPSHTKYNKSRRVPFLVLQDRFRRALHEKETLLLISGYSFEDQHLNEIIFDAAMNRPRSEFIAFCYSGIPDQLAERALKLPNLQALGPDEAYLSEQADWSEPEDAKTVVWDDGSFGLRDFSNLAKFLAQSDIQREDLSQELVLIEEGLKETFEEK